MLTISEARVELSKLSRHMPEFENLYRNPQIKTYSEEEIKEKSSKIYQRFQEHLETTHMIELPQTISDSIKRVFEEMIQEARGKFHFGLETREYFYPKLIHIAESLYNNPPEDAHDERFFGNLTKFNAQDADEATKILANESPELFLQGIRNINENFMNYLHEEYASALPKVITNYVWITICKESVNQDIYTKTYTELEFKYKHYAELAHKVVLYNFTHMLSQN